MKGTLSVLDDRIIFQNYPDKLEEWPEKKKRMLFIEVQHTSILDVVVAQL